MGGAEVLGGGFLVGAEEGGEFVFGVQLEEFGEGLLGDVDDVFGDGAGDVVVGLEVGFGVEGAIIGGVGADCWDA